MPGRATAQRRAPSLLQQSDCAQELPRPLGLIALGRSELYEQVDDSLQVLQQLLHGSEQAVEVLGCKVRGLIGFAHQQVHTVEFFSMPPEHGGQLRRIRKCSCKGSGLFTVTSHGILEHQLVEQLLATSIGPDC